MTPRRRILPLFIPHAGCPHDCVYCAQKHVTGRTVAVTPGDVAKALEALAFDVDELAFYGGSFTALPAEAQRALLGAAQPYLAHGRISSIRVSTRPDAIDKAALDLLEAYRVKTVELGAQSMDDSVLRRCGRGHAAEDIRRAAEQIKANGAFDLVLQMMTGLPGSTEERDIATAEAIAALGPDGARIYPTVILRDTPLYDLWQSGAYREHTVEDAVRVCAKILPVFERANIPVLRLGLNPTDELSYGDAVAGGAYHPALGELVKSRIFYEKARTLLFASKHADSVILGVNKSDVSQMAGQHRQNLAALKTEFHLSSLRVVPEDLPRGDIAIRNDKE